jgi:hypothetical protein
MFTLQKSRIELLELLSEAENDVRSGKVAPISETFSDLRTILQKGNLETPSVLQKL